MLSENYGIDIGPTPLGNGVQQKYESFISELSSRHVKECNNLDSAIMKKDEELQKVRKH